LDLVQFLEKNKKTSHLDHSGHIEGDIIQNHEQNNFTKYTNKTKKKKKKKKESKKTKILWEKQTFFLAPCPSVLGQLWPHGCM
jgi:hypothetical protein